MKATLIEVHTVRREVELPHSCPNCKADLTYDKDTINAWEYQDQRRKGGLDLTSNHFEWDEDSNVLPPSGESFLSFVSYLCADCNCILAESEGSESDVGELPPGAEHARYTLELWWEALRENPSLRCSYEAWVARAMALDGRDESPKKDASG